MHLPALGAALLALTLALPAAAQPAANANVKPKPAPAPAPKAKPRPVAAAAPAPAPVPDEPVTESQLEIATRVHVGHAECELQQRVEVMPIEGRPGHFKVSHGKMAWTMVPMETTTGAVRLEDRRAGTVWIQIPAKSMLMDSRAGRRMVDACQHEAQRVAVAPPAGESIGIVAPVAAPPSN